MSDFEPRRAAPGQSFGYTGPDGEQRELAADKDGVVRPKTAQDVEVLDGFELPVARKVLADEKADEKAKEESPSAAHLTNPDHPAETGAEG